jgi:hypothetical protein
VACDGRTQAGGTPRDDGASFFNLHFCSQTGRVIHSAGERMIPAVPHSMIRTKATSH